KDGSSLIGATISIPEIKSGALSDNEGNYSINNIPGGDFLVEVRYLGYATLTKRISISGTVTADFQLSTAVVEQNEVIVTGVSTATEIKRTPTPIAVIVKAEIQQNASSNIIDAIAREPGISQVTTGPGISKPEIRGLGYNRVVVMNDGTRQEGQQWGDEHGIEIDEYAVNKVEILKGPGSIMYGSDAMAGVINILSPDPVAEGKITADLLANYQTNNGLIGYSGAIAGNEKGFVWLGRVSGKMAHSYQNKYDGYVFNSGFKEMAGSGYVGLNKKWGYSHLNFSLYHFQPGLSEGERDSTGAFTKQVTANGTTVEDITATQDDLTSYSLLTPYQEVNHYKFSLMNTIYIGNSKLHVNTGYENNQRQEFADVLAPDQYGLFFFLSTLPYDVRWTFPESNGWNMTLGVNGMYQDNQNKGTEFLVPDYHLFDAGGFAFIQKIVHKLTLSGGVRYDHRYMQTQSLMLNADDQPVTEPDSFSVIKFKSIQTDFSAVSGSIGASYEISDPVIVKANIARGFRAPNIAELSANGRHEGTFRYEVGNPDLKAETSWQLDAGIGFNTEHLSGEISLFDNNISNFIYPEKLSSISGGDSLMEEEGDFIPVYKYVQGHANLLGGEISFDIHPHPLDWLHFKNSFSYVQSVQQDQPDSMKYLPFTPPAKFQSELRANFSKLNNTFRNFYAEVGLAVYFDQTKVYSAFGTETPTPGYVLLNAGMGADIFAKENILFTINLSGDNLGDIAYQSHLSRLKYAPENLATGRTGIYNMGRNFSLKVNIPIGIKG
ncbi:MAG TPA: TonB-dependent receptor, partial [Chitinophagales bacterium]|nr:TonB-dependent receptor [Chitinophagales bacterium]